MAKPEMEQKIERLAFWPLLVLGMLWIPAFVIEYVDRFSPAQQFWATVAEWAIRGIFAIEFAARIYYVADRASYIRSNWWDLAVIVAPPLRPLRMIRRRLD